MRRKKCTKISRRTRRKKNFFPLGGKIRRTRGVGPGRSFSIFFLQLFDKTFVFVDKSSDVKHTHTHTMNEHREKKLIYVALLCQKQIDAKNAKNIGAAALRLHLINTSDRCYLLPLTSQVMNPVIFSLHTHRLRPRPLRTSSEDAECTALHGRIYLL